MISLYSRKSSMEDRKLLTGRPYGGTAIFIRKDIKCTINCCDVDCNRLCAIMADFDSYTVLFTCFYMPCDSSNNCDSFNSAIDAFQTLRARHGPNYVICGGDFNVQLSRSYSIQTIMFKPFVLQRTLLVHIQLELH